MTSTLDLAPADLTDPATFADGPPHAFLAALRRAAPVWRHPATPRHGGFWVLSRYEDVRDVLMQPSTFVNAHGITIDPNEPAGLSSDDAERGQGALSYTDPPHHRPCASCWPDPSPGGGCGSSRPWSTATPAASSATSWMPAAGTSSPRWPSPIR